MSIDKIRDFIIAILIFELSFFILLMINPGNNAYSSIDSAHYSSAISEYNLSKEQPHLPGYIIYIYSLKALNSLFASSNSPEFNSKYYSMTYLSGLFTAMSLIILYFLFRKWLDWKKSLLLVLATFSIPQVLFYGSNSENYSIDFFFMSLFLLIISKEKRYHWGLLIILIATGFRQSFFLFTAPVYLIEAIPQIKNKKLIFKDFILSLGSSFFVFFIWSYLLISSTNGIGNYFELYHTTNPMPNSGFLINIIGLFSFNLLFIISFLLFFGLNFIHKDFSNLIKDNTFIKQIIQYLFLAFVIFFFHYNKGYFLIIIPILVILIAKLFEINRIKYWQIFGFIILNFTLFFILPYKMPSAETSILNKLRTTSNSQVFQERLFGNYLTTYDLSKSYKNNINQISLLIDKIAKSDSISQFRLFPDCQVAPKISNEIYSSIGPNQFNFDNIYLDDIGTFSLILNSEFKGKQYKKYAIIMSKDLLKYIKTDLSKYEKVENGDFLGFIIDLEKLNIFKP